MGTVTGHGDGMQCLRDLMLAAGCWVPGRWRWCTTSIAHWAICQKRGTARGRLAQLCAAALVLPCCLPLIGVCMLS